MGPNVELETEDGDIRGNRNKCEIYNFEKINEKFMTSNLSKCYEMFIHFCSCIILFRSSQIFNEQRFHEPKKHP